MTPFGFSGNKGLSWVHSPHFTICKDKCYISKWLCLTQRRAECKNENGNNRDEKAIACTSHVPFFPSSSLWEELANSLSLFVPSDASILAHPVLALTVAFSLSSHSVLKDAKAVTESVRLVGSLHKLKPFISL